VDTETITRTALEVLDDVGLDRLSMRTVATRLGVQVGGLYYHVPDKASLLRGMADLLCLRALEELRPTGDWRVDAAGICRQLRLAMLSCRDGARLVAQSPLVGSERALQLMETLQTTLSAGLPEGSVSLAADTLLSYVTGYVLQEQLGDETGPASQAELDALAVRFPRTFSGVGQLSDDEAFGTAVDAIIAGFEG
jgi:TetR/AcrR family transcriptional regulator, tetracycline repressor protein